MSAAGSNDFIPSRLVKNFIDGMFMSVASTTTLSLTSGLCRDSTNAQNISVEAASTTLNFGVNGLNGLDTGSIGATKLYYIFAISSSLDTDGLVTPPGFIASLSSSPTMPETPIGGTPYDIYRRVAWARTGGGSTLLTTYQSGNGNNRFYLYDTMIAVLTNGTSSSLAAIDLSPACPPLDNMSVMLYVEFTPFGAANTVKFTPFGSTATVIQGFSGVVASVKQIETLQVLSKLDTATPKVMYINSAGSCDSDAWVVGFQDVI